MDTHAALRTRRTIQRFRPDPVPEDVLDRALEAAQLAPNHKLTFPWRFVLPGPVTREGLFRVGLRLKAGSRPVSPELEANVRANMLTPGALIVVVQDVAEDPGRAAEDYAACAAAVQNAQLSLHADGYGSKWGTGGTLRDDEARQLLGITASERVIAFLWVGVPEVVPAAPARPAGRVSRLP